MWAEDFFCDETAQQQFTSFAEQLDARSAELILAATFNDVTRDKVENTFIIENLKRAQ